MTGTRATVETLAGVAYSRKLISRQVLDDVRMPTLTQHKKADHLLLAIQDKVLVDPSSFFTFIEILESEPALYYLARTLRAELSSSIPATPTNLVRVSSAEDTRLEYARKSEQGVGGRKDSHLNQEM